MVTCLYVMVNPATPTYGILKKKVSHRKCIINNDLSYYSRALHLHYTIYIKTRNGEHKICYKLELFTCSVDRWLASYGEWKNNS